MPKTRVKKKQKPAKPLNLLFRTMIARLDTPERLRAFKAERKEEIERLVKEVRRG